MCAGMTPWVARAPAAESPISFAASEVGCYRVVESRDKPHAGSVQRVLDHIRLERQEVTAC
jgi:hypothetical protein